jgi:hypothetical protein
MRLLITSLLALLINFGYSQSSVVYKRNAFGELEVYQSQGGLPTGTPIYKIKRNVYGYLEVENVDASINPFSKKPDYSSYNNFKPYQLPVKEIFQTLETINKRNEYDYVNTITDFSNNTKFQQELKEVQQIIEKEDLVAKAFFKFYSSNVSFPKTLKDGWYEVVNIYDMKAVANVVNASSRIGL